MSEREMSLDEILDTSMYLHDGHRARKELAALRERIAALEARNGLLEEVVKHARTHFGCVEPGALAGGMGPNLEEAFEALDKAEGARDET